MIICIAAQGSATRLTFLRGQQRRPSTTSHYRLGRRIAYRLSPFTRPGFNCFFSFGLPFALLSLFFLGSLSTPCSPSPPDVRSTSPMALREAAPPPERQLRELPARQLRHALASHFIGGRQALSLLGSTASRSRLHVAEPPPHVVADCGRNGEVHVSFATCHTPPEKYRRIDADPTDIPERGSPKRAGHPSPPAKRLLFPQWSWFFSFLHGRTLVLKGIGFAVLPVISLLVPPAAPVGPVPSVVVSAGSISQL